MGRVLRLAGGVMGVVLLLTTAGMAWTRRDETPWMLVTDEHLGHGRGLVLIDPNTGLQLPLTRYYSREMRFKAYGKKSGWLYYVGIDGGGSPTWTGGLYRMRLDGRGEPQLIIPNPYITHMTLSHDEQSIAYTVMEDTSDQKHEGTLFRAQSDGEKVLMLTDTFSNGALFEASSLPVYWSQPLYFSQDDKWVIFNGTYDGWLDKTVFRIRMDGTGLEAIAQGNLIEVYRTSEPMDFSWVFVTGIDGSLYSYDAERNPPLVLMDQWVGEPRRLQFLGWLRRSGVAVFSSYGSGEMKVMGIQPNGETVWIADNGTIYATLPDEDWIYVGGWKGLQRLRPDGSQAEFLIETSQEAPTTLLVNDDWLIVELYSVSTLTSTFHRIRTDSNTVETIAEFSPDVSILLITWLPESQYLIYSLLTQDNDRHLIYRTNLDGSHSKILTQGLFEPSFETWLPPIDRGWTPSHLGIIGAGLIGIYIIRPKKWLGKKH